MVKTSNKFGPPKCIANKITCYLSLIRNKKIKSFSISVSMYNNNNFISNKTTLTNSSRYISRLLVVAC